MEEKPFSVKNRLYMGFCCWFILCVTFRFWLPNQVQRNLNVCYCFFFFYYFWVQINQPTLRENLLLQNFFGLYMVGLEIPMINYSFSHTEIVDEL